MNTLAINSSLSNQLAATTAHETRTARENTTLRSSTKPATEASFQVASPSKLEVIYWLRRVFRAEAGDTPEFGLLNCDE